jgi:hypothetical protein
MKELIKQKILVALFMGYVWSDEKNGKTYLKKSADQLNIYSSRPEDLRFDTDWNELMSVAKKIEKISKELIFNTPLLHWVRNNKTIFELKLTETDIETAWKYVIEFIKWYNENEKEAG